MGKYWVSMVDTFMSGWGMAEGKTNVMLVECDTAEQAELIARNAKRRSEMRKVKLHAGKKAPYYSPTSTLVSHKTFADLSGPKRPMGASMNYLRLPHMDDVVSVFDICQAHAQLESDYNVGGWVRERPSNQRRRESTGCQLARVGFHPGIRWVDIYSTDAEDEDGPVRDIYIQNVLKWGLPIADEERAFIAERYVPEFLATFPSWSKT